MTRDSRSRVPRTPARLGVPAAALCLAAALLVAATDARATRERPPTAHTGGFGEPTCHTCHFDNDVDSGPGRLLLRGVPDRAVPGSSYDLTVLLVEPGLLAAGFQLSARFQDGRQAGTLAAAEGHEARTDITTDRNIQYAHHIYDGSLPVAPDTARWTIRWTAPADLEPVVFHVAANAADDDTSPLGDHIYTTSRRTRP